MAIGILVFAYVLMRDPPPRSPGGAAEQAPSAIHARSGIPPIAPEPPAGRTGRTESPPVRGYPGLHLDASQAQAPPQAWQRGPPHPVRQVDRPECTLLVWPGGPWELGSLDTRIIEVLAVQGDLFWHDSRFLMGCTDVTVEEAITDAGESLTPYPLGLSNSRFVLSLPRPDLPPTPGRHYPIQLLLRHPRKPVTSFRHLRCSVSLAIDGPIRVVRIPVSDRDGPWVGVAGLPGAAVRPLAMRVLKDVIPAMPGTSRLERTRFQVRAQLTEPLGRLFAVFRAYAGSHVANDTLDLDLDEEKRLVVTIEFRNEGFISEAELGYFDPQRLVRLDLDLHDLPVMGFPPPVVARHRRPLVLSPVEPKPALGWDPLPSFDPPIDRIVPSRAGSSWHVMY